MSRPKQKEEEGKKRRNDSTVSDTHQICLWCWVELSRGNELIFSSCLCIFCLRLRIQNSNESHFILNCSLCWICTSCCCRYRCCRCRSGALLKLFSPLFIFIFFFFRAALITVCMSAVLLFWCFVSLFVGLWMEFSIQLLLLSTLTFTAQWAFSIEG